jgi:hypothetical protein
LATQAELVAGLVQKHGRARYRHRLDGLGVLQDDGNELAVDQRTVAPPLPPDTRGFDTSPRRVIVSVLVATVLSMKSRVPIWSYSRSPESRFLLSRPPGSQQQDRALQWRCVTNRRDDLHRVLTDNGGQHTRTLRNVIADGDGGAADLTVDRRADFGVVEIDLRLLQLRLGAEDLRLQGIVGGGGAIDIGLLPPVCCIPSSVCCPKIRSGL